MLVGITGGIGSGKSFVCHKLEAIGYPVYQCDDAAKQLMQTDPDLRRQLIDLIGTEAYTPNGLNKPVIAGFLFHSKENARLVDNIVHPAVFRDMQSWYSRQQSSVCFVESAILFEAGFHTAMDATVFVYADEEVRIQRAIERDHSDAAHIRSRMAQQQSADTTRSLADYTLTNNPTSDIDTELRILIEYLNNKTEKEHA